MCCVNRITQLSRALVYGSYALPRMHGLGPRVGRVARVAYRVVMGLFETVLWVDGREFEVTFPSMLYVWNVAGAARGGERINLR